mmetsp:Transcript_19410/g.74524  ORF Transcript_19410/g.74524 Transcript_19410/m.74524 type:complete len:651 (+) Transcript_19410:234-2186(+)
MLRVEHSNDRLLARSYDDVLTSVHVVAARVVHLAVQLRDVEVEVEPAVACQVLTNLVVNSRAEEVLIVGREADHHIATHRSACEDRAFGPDRLPKIPELDRAIKAACGEQVGRAVGELEDIDELVMQIVEGVQEASLCKVVEMDAREIAACEAVLVVAINVQARQILSVVKVGDQRVLITLEPAHVEELHRAVTVSADEHAGAPSQPAQPQHTTPRSSVDGTVLLQSTRVHHNVLSVWSSIHEHARHRRVVLELARLHVRVDGQKALAWLFEAGHKRTAHLVAKVGGASRCTVRQADTSAPPRHAGSQLAGEDTVNDLASARQAVGDILERSVVHLAGLLPPAIVERPSVKNLQLRQVVDHEVLVVALHADGRRQLFHLCPCKRSPRHCSVGGRSTRSGCHDVGQNLVLPVLLLFIQREDEVVVLFVVGAALLVEPEVRRVLVDHILHCADELSHRDGSVLRHARQVASKGAEVVHRVVHSQALQRLAEHLQFSDVQSLSQVTDAVCEVLQRRSPENVPVLPHALANGSLPVGERGEALCERPREVAEGRRQPLQPPEADVTNAANHHVDDGLCFHLDILQCLSLEDLVLDERVILLAEVELAKAADLLQGSDRRPQVQYLRSTEVDLSQLVQALEVLRENVPNWITIQH